MIYDNTINYRISYKDMITEEISKLYRIKTAEFLLDLVDAFDTKNKITQNTIIDRIKLIQNEDNNTEIDIINAIIDTVNYLNKKTDTNKSEKTELNNEISRLQDTFNFTKPEEILDNNLIKVEKFIEEIEEKMLLTESTTFFDLRMFLTNVYKYTSNSQLKNLLTELCKAIGQMEMDNIPLSSRPQINKLRSLSPNLFK